MRSLNPCFNGRYSQSLIKSKKVEISSLNPCSNGRYSQSNYKPFSTRLVMVLILVLMEDTLRVDQSIYNILVFNVLILVLMEDTLRAPNGQTFEINPEVLILVLMEDTLRDTTHTVVYNRPRLNPCSNGRYSQRTTFKNYEESIGLNPCSNGRYSQSLR